MADKSILEYKISPLWQAGVLLGGILIFNIGAWILSYTGLVSLENNTPWMVSLSLSLLYVLSNRVLSFSAEDRNRYLWQSIVGFVLIMVLGALIAYMISGTSFTGFGVIISIYKVVTAAFAVTFVITRAMRTLLTYAEEQT